MTKLSKLENILKNIGFHKIAVADQTSYGIPFFESLLAKINAFGFPLLRLSVLMGTETKKKIKNLRNALADIKLLLQSGVYN